ncbi:MAG: SEC-C metal-binding domain-containing protein [Sphingosinicella sp.]|uniref:SEC-C metal-binding domain-containing protein n=1 Tax=Sphingosinicella sp. TaxID=1917971 RepID=UPI00403812C3
MVTSPPRRLVSPRRNDPCLCGSGRLFRECCRDHLPGHKMGEAWRDPARRKQWPKVLRALRADLTQYTIYHRTNTVPLRGAISNTTVMFDLRTDTGHAQNLRSVVLAFDTVAGELQAVTGVNPVTSVLSPFASLRPQAGRLLRSLRAAPAAASPPASLRSGTKREQTIFLQPPP